MALILSIETATSVCSVALLDDTKPLSKTELFTEYAHSEMLTTLIHQTVKNAGFELKQLNAVALSKGPGSYTGLRIGTATVKGLCFALDIPLLAVNTLEAMTAKAIAGNSGELVYCPMIDARRMEVYCTLLDQNLHPIEPTQAKIIDLHSFKDQLREQKILFFGNGSAKCRQVLSASPNAFFLEDFHPDAVFVGKLAYRQFSEQIFEDTAYFEPFYLKEFVRNKIQ